MSYRIWLVGLLLSAMISLAACNSAKVSTSSPSPSPSPSAPLPDLASLVPRDYRVMKVLTGPLDGGPIPNQVVQSAGPLDRFGNHPEDVQVLAWDAVARRWFVAFDARKVSLPAYSDSNWWPPSLSPQNNQTLLPRGRADLIHQMQFVSLGPKPTQALVFTADVNAGANQPSEVVIVDFQQGEAQVGYCWYGDDLPRLSVSGVAPDQRVAVRADLFTAVDPLSTPARTYHFVVGSTQQGITAISDDRPWLGVYGNISGLSASSPLPILGTVPGSPASRLLRKGDLLVAVNDQPIPSNAFALGPYVVDQLERRHAHERVRLIVQRGGSVVSIRVRLGSLLDASARNVIAATDYSELVL